MSINTNQALVSYKGFPNFPDHHPASILSLCNRQFTKVDFPIEVSIEDEFLFSLKKCQNFFNNGLLLEAIKHCTLLQQQDLPEQIKKECQDLNNTICDHLKKKIDSLIAEGKFAEAFSLAGSTLHFCPWNTDIQTLKQTAYDCDTKLKETRKALNKKRYQSVRKLASEELRHVPQSDKFLFSLKMDQDFFSNGFLLEAAKQCSLLLLQDLSEQIKKECQDLYRTTYYHLKKKIDSLIAEGKFAEAFSLADSTLHFYPGNTHVQQQKQTAYDYNINLNEARIALVQKDYPSAVKLTSEILKNVPGSEEAKKIGYTVGMMHVRNLSVPEGNKFAEEFLKEVERYYSLGKFLEAIGSCKLISEINCVSSLKETAGHYLRKNTICMGFLNNMHLEMQKRNYKNVISIFNNFSLFYPYCHSEAYQMQTNAIEQLKLRDKPNSSRH